MQLSLTWCKDPPPADPEDLDQAPDPVSEEDDDDGDEINYADNDKFANFHHT